MDLGKVIVLLLTALAVGVLVYLEMQARKSRAAAKQGLPTEKSPSTAASDRDAFVSDRGRGARNVE